MVVVRKGAVHPGRTSSMKKAWRVLKKSFDNFIADDAPTLAAALAFYTALSLAPLLLLLMKLSGIFGGSPRREATVVSRANSGADHPADR
jgi:membrane protein